MNIGRSVMQEQDVGKLFMRMYFLKYVVTVVLIAWIFPVTAQEDGWTLNLYDAAIPDRIASGRMGGSTFVVDQARIEDGGRLHLVQGLGAFPDIEIILFFFLGEGETLENKALIVSPIQEFGLPHIQLNLRNTESGLMETITILDTYAMRLETGEWHQGLMKGRIYLCLHDHLKSYVAGNFTIYDNTYIPEEDVAVKVVDKIAKMDLMMIGGLLLSFVVVFISIPACLWILFIAFDEGISWGLALLLSALLASALIGAGIFFLYAYIKVLYLIIAVLACFTLHLLLSLIFIFKNLDRTWKPLLLCVFACLGSCGGSYMVMSSMRVSFGRLGEIIQEQITLLQEQADAQLDQSSTESTNDFSVSAMMSDIEAQDNTSQQPETTGADVVATPLGPESIQIGDMEGKVLKIMGRPRMTWEVGPNKVLRYPSGEIQIRNGRVIEMNLKYLK